jgi:hypothetical protein
MPFDELEEDIEPLLGDEFSVKLVVSRISIFKAAKHLGDAFHHDNSTTATRIYLDEELLGSSSVAGRNVERSDRRHSPNDS